MRQRFGGCSHSSTITTITAGLAREVCEACSHVSVRYVEQAVRLYPDIETRRGLSSARHDGSGNGDRAIPFDTAITFAEDSAILGCGLCAQAAVYMVPGGLRCGEHAWQEAALLDWEQAEPWVPIRLGATAS